GLGVFLELIQIAAHGRFAGPNPGEQIAEAAPHLAKRYVYVEEDRFARLLLPHLRYWYRLVEAAISRLMRVRIRVTFIYRSGGEARGRYHDAPSRRKKSVYGTVQTAV